MGMWLVKKFSSNDPKSLHTKIAFGKHRKQTGYTWERGVAVVLVHPANGTMLLGHHRHWGRVISSLP